ncbi:MAG: cytochrome c biogenesis protein CcsA [Myxococcales bacterium]|nr:cytochrome c biogenesis protein CcsA [Myxococcales bacterium]
MPFWSPLALLAVALGLVITHFAVPTTRAWMWKASAVVGLGALALLLYLGLIWAPPEAFMSDVGRILYVHVPFVWMCMIAFTLNVGCAIAYLMKKSWRTDALAESTAEIGVMFGAGGVLMGSIWARPTWGVWWDWDPRLISTAVMLLSYVGYLAFRSFTEDPERRATWSAAASILGYVSLPIVWFSVRWWNSLHQVQSTSQSLDSQMRIVMWWGTVTMLFFLFAFVVKRYEIARSRQSSALEAPPEAPRQEVAA